MAEQLRSFLESVRVKKGEPFTHTTKSPAGSYFIGEDASEEFLTLYCNAIFKNNSPTVTEKPGAYGPLRFDFDLKTSLDDGLKRKYTEAILKNIITIIVDELKKAVDDDAYDDRLFYSIVLEKKAPRVEDGIIKDGFHFHFPNFVCDAWFQDEYMRTKITERMITQKIWEGIKYNESVEKFVDVNMARKQWLMYGSAKAEGAEPFLATKCYDVNVKPITIDKIFEDDMVGRKCKLRYYLPRFMSIQGYAEYIKLKESVESKRVVYRAKRTRRGIVTKKRSMEEVMEDIKLIIDADIMGMLSDERADDQNTWIDVGWTLFNIGQGCEEALELFIDFSRRSDKFVEGECEEKWAKMEMKDKTIGSLFFMARSDSPDRYKEWKDTNIRTYLERSLFEAKPNEWDVAQVVHKLYRERFVCADAKHDLWYEFSGHRWRHMDDNVPIRRLFAEELANIYIEFRIEKIKQQKGADDDKRAESEGHAKKCGAIVTALKSDGFHKKLLNMCKLLFHDPLFMKKLDENKTIFVCDNTVLDLELMCWRDGRPDDYASYSCNLNFPKEARRDDDEIMEVETYLKRVFPNFNRRKYFKDTASATLEGGNVNKTFIVGTGSGDNAKTVTYSFLEMAFGDYCIKFPRELFVVGKGNSSGGPRPELARVRGRRLAIAQEIAKTETLNIGIVKELTGNDSFFARGMYEKGTDIKPGFTLFMACATGDTRISMPAGFSMPLRDLNENATILSWDVKTNGVKPIAQRRFIEKGMKECMRITLKDGTFIECTPDHKLLLSDNRWSETKDLKIGNEMKMSQHQPYYDDLNDPCDYEFFDYDLNNLQDKLHAMAVCRLMGYNLADGTNNVCLYMGHKIDAETVVNDITLLTGKIPTITRGQSSYHVNIPTEIVKMLNVLSEPQGRRIVNPMILPKFMFDKDCPTFLLREILAGMFGGDGIVACIQANGDNGRKHVTPIKYIASKITEHVPGLIAQFNKIVGLLKTRFNIESYVETPIHYEEDKYHVQITINKCDGIKKFIEKIGIRYCCHKSYRLTAILKYLQYKDAINEQNENIVARTRDLVDKYNRQNPKPKIMQFTKNDKYIATFDSTQKAQHSTGINHSLINGACKRNELAGDNSKCVSKGYIWRYHYDVTPTIEDECGYQSYKEAVQHAINEQPFIYNTSKLVTYTQLTHRLAKGDTYTQQQNGDLMDEFLNETGLIKFCNNGKKTNYSVDFDATTLPTYKMKIVGIEHIGKHEVFDLTVEEPYSNYVTNCMISHNCNEPPKVPGHDEATWNRIRILEYESKFVKPADLKRFPVPDSDEEQMDMKRFKADVSFMKRLPELAPYLLWILFDNFKEYKRTGLHEPAEVQIATSAYKAMNDVYSQYIEECMQKVSDAELLLDTTKDKYFLDSKELYDEFVTWYHENNSSYAKEKFNKITIIHEFNKRFPEHKMKKGRRVGWYGYQIINEEGLDTEKTRRLHETLTKKIAPKAKGILDQKAAAGAPKVAKAKVKVVPKVIKAKAKATNGVKLQSGGALGAAAGAPKIAAAKAKVIRAK